MEQISNLFAPALRRVRESEKRRAESGERRDLPKSLSKDYVRTEIAGGVTLSIPIVGGNSILKRRDLRIGQIMISSHGDWQHKHLGAWQTVYGKTPYFLHIYPMLKEVYDNCSNGSLIEFNNAIFRIVTDFLELDAIEDSVKRLDKKKPQLLGDIRRETFAKCNPEITVFDSLFRLGKDAVYLFI